MDIRNPELSRGRNYREKGAHETDNISVANIDYCGIVSLIRGLLQRKLCTAEEAKKIAARIAVQLGADIILNI